MSNFTYLHVELHIHVEHRVHVNLHVHIKLYEHVELRAVELVTHVPTYRDVLRDL
jgi:hypothetical protein